MKINLVASAHVVAVSLFLVSCAPGSGEGLNVSGRPLSEGGDLPLAPTLESIQVNVFDAACIVCHAGAAAPLGLRLDTDSSFVNLVGVSSSQVGSLLRVDPGDPDRSYLVRKLEGTAAEGELMPLGGPPLPQATIDFVRQWITDGALPDSQSPPGQSPVVISMSPAPESMGPDFPTEITIGFDRDIDSSTVNALTFTLLRSGGDGIFGDAADVDVALTSVGLSPANPRLVVMDLSGVTQIDDRYRVTAEGSGPNQVLSVGGVALDGEFTGMFPSGDGNEGGDFVAEFTIAGLQPSLESIQANVLTPNCATAGCHTGPMGGGLPAGMDLSTSDGSFASLVNVVSIRGAPTPRVVPMDADGSFLIHKLEGTQGAGQGGQMPAAAPPLDQATIDVIRVWIDNGAER
jgi:hypothetical protein